jgi:tetratricopeptide (TPR) repeat protein
MAIYDAFISYSHAKDKPIAAALQSAIQKLGKPWYKRRALWLFRDDSSLSATPHLWPTIEQALGQSRYLILLASPEAAASHWVCKEVAYWLDTKSADTLLIAVTAGTLVWDNATNDFGWHDGTPLPPALRGRFAAEPKWVDLTAYRAGADKGDTKFTELAADFAAAIRGMPKEDLLSQEVTQQRRALRLAFTAAALLLVLAIGATTAGILAVRSQREAVAQRDRAEQTLAAATETASSLVFDLAQRFENAVGVPAALIKDILDRALALQQQLLASGQVTSKLQRSMAGALGESADVLLMIGDGAGALAAAQRCRQLFEELAAAAPGDGERQHEVAICNEKVGDALLAAGKREEALEDYRKALAIHQKLAQDEPARTLWQRALAVDYQHVGNVFEQAGQLEQALEHYRMGLAIAQNLSDSDPGNAEWQSDLAVSYDHTGDMLRLNGRLDEALATYEKVLPIRRKLAESEPGNGDRQRGLTVSYSKIGRILLALDKPAQALAYMQDNLVFLQKLADSDPGNARWQQGLSVGYEDLGETFIGLNRYDDALSAFQRALAITEQLAARDPANAEGRNGLAISYQHVGEALRKLNRLYEALTAFRRSLEIVRKLVETDAGNAKWHHSLFFSEFKVGDVLKAQGRLRDASAAFRESLATAQGLLQQDPNNADWRRDVPVTASRLGGLSWSFILEREFVDALEAADPAIAAAPNELWLYANRAHALMFAGRVPEARAVYLQYRGQKDIGLEGKPWETVIHEDFAELRKAGLTHPLMDEIEALFSGRG